LAKIIDFQVVLLFNIHFPSGVASTHPAARVAGRHRSSDTVPFAIES
jgi:hypothetical protein